MAGWGSGKGDERGDPFGSVREGPAVRGRAGRCRSVL